MPRFGDFEQYFNNSGDILNGGKLYFYESGTTTPKDTYADINQTTPNSNPVVLSAAGRQGNIWFSGVAKVVLTTSADVILQTLDPVGDTDVQAQFSTWVPTFSYAMYSVVLYDGLFYVSLVNNNLGNTPDASPTDWQPATEFFLQSQTVVPEGQIAIGDSTTGFAGLDSTPKGTLVVGDGTTTTTLAVGTNTYVLTADSVEANGVKWAPTSGGGLTLLSTVTPTAAANVDFLSTFTSNYDAYTIEFEELAPASYTSTPVLTFRFGVAGSADTGSNYIATVTASSTTATSGTVFSTGLDTGVITGKIEVKNANGTTQPKIVLTIGVTSRTAGPNTYTYFNQAITYVAANAVSGMRLYWSTGTNFVAQGKVRIYGFQN